MEAAIARVTNGDFSALPFISQSLEGPGPAPTGKRGCRLYHALVEVLLREGGVLSTRASNGQAFSADHADANTPPDHCFLAMSVLGSVGQRKSADGVECRGVILCAGLQRCRMMILDAYFVQNMTNRYYAVNFVALLTHIFGCSVRDVILSPANVHYVVESTQTFAGADGPRRGGSPSDGAAASGLPPVQPVPHAALVRSVAPFTATEQNGQVVAVQHAPPIPARSTFGIPINGTSGTVSSGSPGRRYRSLPLKPAVTPYATNPLYDPSIDACDNTLFSAQFPLPVVQFTQFHGLGCVPRVPGAASFSARQTFIARDGASSRRRGTRRARGRQSGAVSESSRSGTSTPQSGGSQLTSPTPPPSITVPSSLAKGVRMQAVAERLRDWTATGAAEEAGALADDPLGAPRKPQASPKSLTLASASLSAQSSCMLQEELSLVFVDSSTEAALALNRACLAAPLLREYLEEGKLLGWGDARYGALGPVKSSAGGQKTMASSTSRLLTTPDHLSTGEACSTATATASPVLADGVAALLESSCSEDPYELSTKARRGHFSNPSFSSGNTGLQHGTSASPTGHGTSAPPCSALTAALPPGAPPTSRFLGGAASTPPCHVFAPTAVPTPGKVVNVCCGVNTTYVLTAKGVLCSCGRGENGQLGTGERGLRYAEAGAERFQKVKLSQDEQAVMSFAGGTSAAAVSLDGYIYCWGGNMYGQCLRRPEAARVLLPLRFKTGPFKPVMMGFGKQCGCILFDDGVVGTWGISTMLGVHVPDEELEPTLAADGSKCTRRICHPQTAFEAPVALLRAGPAHFVAVTRTGKVYSWGEGSHGRLGHGTEQSETSPRLLEGLEPHIVVDAGCGAAHTALVTSTGAVFTFGQNSHGQLGLQSGQVCRTPVALRLPAPALTVVCGQEYTLVLLINGCVMACGSACVCGAGLGQGRAFLTPTYILTNYVTLKLAGGPTHAFAAVTNRTTALLRVGHSSIAELSHMESLVARNGVRDVAVGVGFVVVLSESGVAVALGRGETGQLGVGSAMRPAKPGDVTVLSTFERVRLPPEVQLTALSCGPDYVMAIDRQQVVYGWGNNRTGLLLQQAEPGAPAGTATSATPAGVSGPSQASPPPTVAVGADPTAVYEPRVVSAYNDRRVVQLACGGAFVVALTEWGEVLTHGEYMYCGLSSSVQAPTRAANKRGVVVLRPTVVPSLRQIVSVAAGKEHAVALGLGCVVHAWGRGVLGTGSPSSIAYAPVRVALTQGIRRIGCGPCNSFAITANGDLFVWGSNAHCQCGVPAPTRDAAAEPESPAPASPPQPVSTQAVTVPTQVATGVRDAAFTTRFAIVLLEDGSIRASGQLRHGGQDFELRSFADSPQPSFTINLNSAPSNTFSAAAAEDDAQSPGGSERSQTEFGSASSPVATNNPSPFRDVFLVHEARQLSTGETSFSPMRSTSSPRSRTSADRATAPQRSSPRTARATPMAPMPKPPSAPRPSSARPGAAANCTQSDGLESSNSTVWHTMGSPNSQHRLCSLPRAVTAAHAVHEPMDLGIDTAGPSSTFQPLTATTVHASPAPSPSPPSALSDCAGVRCYGGWEQVFAVVEKHRPPAEDVRRAYRGLHVFLQQRD